MKTTILESYRVVESVLFWSAALPAAFLALPVLVFAHKAKDLFHAAATATAPNHLTPRAA